MDDGAISDSPAFIIRQPEGFVASIVELRDVHRTSEDEAELVLAQYRLGGSALERSRRLRVKGVVSEEFEGSAVELVGAALTHDVDLVGAKAVLRGIVSTLYFEFLDRVLRQNHRRRVQGRIHVAYRPSVVVRFRPAAVDADGIPRPCRIWPCSPLA